MSILDERDRGSAHRQNARAVLVFPSRLSRQVRAKSTGGSPEDLHGDSYARARTHLPLFVERENGPVGNTPEVVHSKLKRAEDTMTRDKWKSRSLYITSLFRETRARSFAPIGRIQPNDVAPLATFLSFRACRFERREIPFHAHAVHRHVSPIERREKWRPTGSDVSEAWIGSKPGAGICLGACNALSLSLSLNNTIGSLKR